MPTIESQGALLYVAGLLTGVLIALRWKRRPTDEQLYPFLEDWEMTGKEIAAFLNQRDQINFWERKWREGATPESEGTPRPPKRPRRRSVSRAPAIVAATLGAWLLLSSFGPVPAPARQDARCLEVNAAFVLRRAVERPVQSNGVTISVPAGYAVAWSCISLDEAQAELARQIAQIK